MIHHDDVHAVRLLRLEHGKVQAIDAELLQDIDEALARAEDDGVKALILTGTGASFSAGVNLYRVIEGGISYVEAFLPLLSKVLLRLFRFPRPVVAGVNGHAIAGGALLAWCADLRVMASGPGRIGVPELRVGVPFPAAALEIARFACGTARLPELVYSGRLCLPNEALELGLVDEVVAPDVLVGRTIELAAALAALPEAAFRHTKESLRATTIEAIERFAPARDSQTLASWTDTATRQRIREYLDRTVLRSKH